MPYTFTPDLNDLLLEIKTHVDTVWPDITASQIWMSESLGAKDLNTLQAPYAMIYLGEPTREDWGLGNNAFNYPIIIHYVRAPNQTDDIVRDRIQALQLHFDDAATNDLSNGQVMNCEGPTMNRYSPLNKEFIDRNLPFRGGFLIVNVLYWDEK